MNVEGHPEIWVPHFSHRVCRGDLRPARHATPASRKWALPAALRAVGAAKGGMQRWQQQEQQGASLVAQQMSAHAGTLSRISAA